MVSGTAWYLWNFRRHVISGLVDSGWEIHAVAGADAYSADLAGLEGVTVHDWTVSLDDAHPGQEFMSLVGLTHMLRRLKPRIVFNNGIKANVYGGLACRALRLPYVNNISGLGMRIRRGTRGSTVLARLYAVASAGAKALLIQNPGDLEFLRSHGLPASCRAIRTMGSGVDLAQFTPVPLPEDWPVRIVFVGRLQADKGIHDLVAAARILSRTRDDIAVDVVGGLQHANAGAVTQETLSDWEAEGLVTFAGQQADVRPFLAAAHALVMPSHGGEGMPKVIIEAAAMGRPAIVSDIDGCRDSIVAGETGLPAPPRDPDGLARVIATFADMPASRKTAMSQAARARAEAAFSVETIVEIYRELVSEVDS
ncbi:N,N'-diacetylbacillosaminyl-diphospho-undecaprenol alpha-1,3-N-acetylgalactosaminyltransferase [Jannaschia aquimarina]|uniref:PglA protein n=2 Tax=Jannaschia aquimarina TaxID=935700 RepID=A0A0D1DD70_9RHOB|nr:N,N'-diacetylbacillosaminyl-diphospho-undecaprenol alpha-1,3-N-acetylgalactosaminyltransferase [Jannaschia aquimarina]SNT08412.1 Glycosyltransferase involved in cell wall bisynthesis [Jannaschia aquimarina]